MIVHISFINDSSDTHVSIFIYNLMLAVVFSKTYSIKNEAFFNHAVEFFKLPSGPYILRISSASIKQTEKIIKN